MPVCDVTLDQLYRRFDGCRIGRIKIRKLFSEKIEERLKNGFELAPQTKMDYEYCLSCGDGHGRLPYRQVL